MSSGESSLVGAMKTMALAFLIFLNCSLSLFNTHLNCFFNVATSFFKLRVGWPFSDNETLKTIWLGLRVWLWVLFWTLKRFYY